MGSRWSRLAGCGAVVLGGACREDCEPDVRGGSPEEQASIQAAVEIFYDRLRPDLGLCVPSVRKKDELQEAVKGHYNSVTRQVRIATPTDDVVYHELCHAVQYQNDLSVEGPNWEMDELLDEALGHPRFPRREAFARTCEDGPTYAFLLGEACPYDPPGIDALYEVRDLFTGPDPRVVLDEEGTFTPTVSLATEGDSFDLEVTANGVRLTLAEGARFIDPWTGERLQEEAVVDPVRTPRASGDGDSLSHFALAAANGALTLRRVYERSEGYVPLGCVKPEENVFSFDGWVWSAHLEEGEVTLGFWLVP